MAQVRHSQLTGSDLHEPKGVASAADHAIAQASGGTVTWSTGINPATFTLSTPVWTDLRLQINVQSGGGSNPPELTKLVDNGAASTGILCYHFDAAVEKELFFSAHLPHGYVAGTDITFHIHWCPTTTNTGSVVWGVEYAIVNTGETYGVSTLATTTIAANGVAKKIQATNIATVTGTAFVPGESTIIGRIYRKAADVADTYTGAAALLSADVHCRVSTLGTASVA